MVGGQNTGAMQGKSSQAKQMEGGAMEWDGMGMELSSPGLFRQTDRLSEGERG